MDKIIKSPPPTLEEAIFIKNAGREVHRFVQNRWSATEWETAWFVNPRVGLYSASNLRQYLSALDQLTCRDSKAFQV